MSQDPTCVLRLGQYEVNLMKKLGQGGFGVVFAGVDTRSRIKVAAKQIDIKRKERHGSTALSEIKVLQKLPSHQNLIRFLDYHFSQDSFWIVMDFCNMGEMKEYFVAHAPIDLATKVDFMRQIAAALVHLHEAPQQIIHRDLKPNNIMVSYISTDDRPMIKVTDFGLAKVAEEDMTKTFLLSTVAGAVCYLSPEEFARQKYTVLVDVFALGLVFLGMINFDVLGELIPVPPGSQDSMLATMLMPIGMQMLQAAIGGGIQPKLVQHEPDDSPEVTQLKDLIQHMAVYKVEERFTSRQVYDTLDKLYEGIKHSQSPPPARPPDQLAEAGSPRQEPGARAAEAAAHAQDSPERGAAQRDGHRDIGYKLLKEAMGQLLRDRIQDRRRGRERDKHLRALDRGMPLLEMLLGHDERDDQQEGKENETNESEFKEGETVQVVKVSVTRAVGMQENYGGWHNEMAQYLGKTGKVVELVLHVVKVKFEDGKKWSFNPAMLKKVQGEVSPSSRRDKNKRSAMRARQVACHFKRMDIVQIAEDEELVKTLQKGHGGWKDKMKHSLGVKGIVHGVDRDGDVVVECINQDKWYFNPELLIKVEPDENAELAAGDVVLVKDLDFEVAKTLQEEIGEWNIAMAESFGRGGIVKSVLSENKIRVEVSRDAWIFHRALLIQVAKSDELMHAILRKKFRRT
ncbi:uncharacterized protein LOC106181717 [Lingula anatina]|uniref:Uncharacterized protein LOC106181717 n=1 Tax=Lingula anatina TaxID=7574 RepID=A0A1S3KGQ5_LINAN|nr:uncharacterized protein LOC106181717 [Lingula anatina]|eukprot:XP_013421639.1 uncharacterized protein LOC106181717 [Lingula anatina]